MALDVRMQLEIHVQMRRIRREPAIPFQRRRHSLENLTRNTHMSDDLDSSSSGSTIDEDDDLNDGTMENDSTSRADRRSNSSVHSHDSSQTHLSVTNINLEN